MTNTETTKEISMMCLGSPIEFRLLDKLRYLEHPDVPDVHWLQPRNLFIAHQDFFKMKPDLDLKKFLSILKTEILHKYFPMILKPGDLSITYNSRIPKSLDWHLGVSSLKDTRLPLNSMKAMIDKEMEALLKEVCLSLQSIRFAPSIRLARIASSAKNDPKLKELELIKMPLTDENIIIAKLMLIKVTKDEFGLNYEYIDVPEF